MYRGRGREEERKRGREEDRERERERERALTRLREKWRAMPSAVSEFKFVVPFSLVLLLQL